jgi:predicted nuclease of restriction endonuclease-like RecB superfamily
MLPSELLAVWKRKGEILPRYAKLSPENLKVAESLIQVYSGHIGEKKKVFKASISSLEDQGHEYRFIRGLAFMLDRRSTFACVSKLDPIEVRRRIFSATSDLGLAFSSEKRRKIITGVASDLGLKVEDVEENFYADLGDELVLEKFLPLSPEDLFEKYNLSLTQTLLFESTELKFTVPSNWQRIFYAVKKFGLIYEVYRENGFWVKIDGPSSLFKLTRRYGLAIARLLPIILTNPGWNVEAKILWKYTNEICDFKIESRKHGSMFRKSETTALSYDSTIEESFASRFQALKTGWVLTREPEPVPAGKQVIIPDFALEKESVKVYVEIVGFWTEEYLLRKIEKLKKVDAKILLLVNERLACDKLTQLSKQPQLSLIYYHDKIQLSPVLHYLEGIFSEIKTRQIEFLKNLPVTFTEPVVRFEEFAARVGVSAEAARTVLTSNPPFGYAVLTNSLVARSKLEKIKAQISERINKSGKLLLPEATKIVEDENLPDATSVLKAIGSKITWRGINEEQAEVSKPVDKNDSH